MTAKSPASGSDGPGKGKQVENPSAVPPHSAPDSVLAPIPVPERRRLVDRRKTPGVSPTGVERRSGQDRRLQGKSAVSGLQRRKGAGIRRAEDRRMAEEGEMTDEQFAFLQAVNEFRKVNSINFPTYTDILAILKYLGYRRVAPVGEIDIDGFTAEQRAARAHVPEAGELDLDA